MKTRRSFLTGLFALMISPLKSWGEKKEEMFMWIKKSTDRGHAHHGWLKSHHTFSFADYYDPRFMGFSDLRVINEDFIQGGMGFGSHPHRDMEIITYVIKGSLRHKDSMGNEAVIRPGEVQHMSAGTGVVHSEFSDDKDETHLLQIWLMPEKLGIKPVYGQKNFSEQFEKNKLTLVVSKDGRDGSIGINQETDLFVSRLKANEEFPFTLKAGRKMWVQVVRGSLSVNGNALSDGDALAVEDGGLLNFSAKSDSEFLIFDLKK
jgi:quercetin 2,3-dioxygenase